jgi:hypothetical protein
MSLGNWGVVKNQIEGLGASEPEFEDRLAGTETWGRNQGTASFLSALDGIATRADLDPSKDIKVRVALFDGVNDVDISTTPALLLGAMAWTNATQSEDVAVLFYNTNTPTEGTTRYLASFMVGAGGTAATAKSSSVVYTEPVEFTTALTFSVVDNGADGDIEAAGLGDASGVKVLIVYAN